MLSPRIIIQTSFFILCPFSRENPIACGDTEITKSSELTSGSPSTPQTRKMVDVNKMPTDLNEAIEVINVLKERSGLTTKPSELTTGSTTTTPKIQKIVDKTPTDLKEANEIISALKEDLNSTSIKCSFYEIMLGLRGLLQELEDELYPLEALSRIFNRYYRWLIILFTCQRNPKVQFMIDLMAKQDGPNKVEMHKFAEEAQKFFPDDTEAIQSISFPKSCIDPNALEHMLKTEGKKLTWMERILISILVKTKYPTTQQSLTTSVVDDSTGPEDYIDMRYVCIRVQGKFDFPTHEEADKEIRHFFKDTDKTPVIDEIKDMSKSGWGEGSYKVEFYYMNYAVQAFHDHLLSIRHTKHQFTLSWIHCDTEEITVQKVVEPPAFAQ